MSKNLTEIICIIDNSGSMYALVDDTVGGYNGFIGQQKSVEGEARVTTVLFNSSHKKIHDAVDIREVEPLTAEQYAPGGMTALLDAVGDTLDELQDRIDDMSDAERPDKVICAIITDGCENSSRKYTKPAIQKMVKHLTNGHGWQFVFLGANMDAVTEAASYGIHTAATYYADSLCTKAVYDSISTATTSYRVDGAVTSDWCSAVSEANQASNKSCDMTYSVMEGV